VIDLQRLRVYISERVKESARLSQAHVPDLIRRAHIHSESVGKQILEEIDAAVLEGAARD
jgi:hypothetical protein